MKRRTRSRRRRIHRGGLFGAPEYVSAIAGNTISQQDANVGTIAPWSNTHSQELANMYQGGRRKRRTFRRRTFRRR
jgi:hypothetical protein